MQSLLAAVCFFIIEAPVRLLVGTLLIFGKSCLVLPSNRRKKPAAAPHSALQHCPSPTANCEIGRCLLPVSHSRSPLVAQWLLSAETLRSKGHQGLQIKRILIKLHSIRQADFTCCEPTTEDAADILAADRIFPGLLFRCIFVPKRDGRNVAVSLPSLFFATPTRRYRPDTTCNPNPFKPTPQSLTRWACIPADPPTRFPPSTSIQLPAAPPRRYGPRVIAALLPALFVD
jgi:hypothetical protein